jgi:hypothetical protein
MLAEFIWDTYPTLATRRDSKALIQNPWMIRPAINILKVVAASATAVPIIAISVENRKMGRFPHLRDKAQ